VGDFKTVRTVLTPPCASTVRRPARAAAESDPDYTTRPEPGNTLTALRALVQGADLGLAPSVGDCGTATAGCEF